EIIAINRKLTSYKQEISNHEKTLTELAELKSKLANIEEEAQKLSGTNSSGQTILSQLEESKKKLQEYEDKDKEYQAKIAGLEEYADKQEKANENLYKGSNKRIEELTAEKEKLIV